MRSRQEPHKQSAASSACSFSRQPWHVDASDIVSLLSLKAARSGGRRWAGPSCFVGDAWMGVP